MYMDLSTYGWFHTYVDGFLPHGAADEYNVRLQISILLAKSFAQPLYKH